MKKKHNPKLGPLGIFIAILLVAFGFYFVTNKNISQQFSVTQNLEFKKYSSDRLRVSFNYPGDWKLLEFPNVIVIGNNQTSLNFGNNIYSAKPSKKDISIKISMSQLLQNQSFIDYIKEIEKNSLSTSLIESRNINGNKSITKEVSYVINGDSFRYINFYLERKNKIYIISATPADSELLPVLNKIVDSIEFK